MVYKRKIECPECTCGIKLFLVSNPLILILNCPECQSNLLYTEGEVFKVNDPQITTMEVHQIKDYIKELKESKMSNNGNLDNPTNNWLSMPERESKMRDENEEETYELFINSKPNKIITNDVANSKPNKIITNDDMANLKIDLETSKDVDDFINKM